MKKFRAFMEKYYPEADKTESGALTAWNASNVLVEVLKKCGDNLTRENVMKQAANLDIDRRHLLAGYPDQDFTDRLLPDRGAADDEVQWRQVGNVRADDRRACGGFKLIR